MTANSDINWNEIWRTAFENHMISRSQGEYALMWDTKEKAEKYLQMMEQNPDRVQKTLSLFSFSPDSRILDIGAGPGTLSIPLSGKVNHVTAVEPAKGMAELLKERSQKEIRGNIDIVQKRWEDIDIQKDLTPPYDLVIASYSLVMPDLKQAIETMQKVCSGEIWLFWMAGMNSWENQMKKLWPVIHGKSFTSPPKADVLFNVLYQMNIYPSVSFTEMGHVKSFSSIEEAVEETRKKLNCSPDYDNQIKELLLPDLVSQDGKYINQERYKSVCFTWKNKA